MHFVMLYIYMIQGDKGGRFFFNLIIWMIQSKACKMYDIINELYALEEQKKSLKKG